MGKFSKQGKFSDKKTPQVDPSLDEMNDESVKSPNTKRTVVIVIALCMVLCILAGIYFASNLGFSVTMPAKVIANGVTIAGVDVGGM